MTLGTKPTSFFKYIISSKKLLTILLALLTLNVSAQLKLKFDSSLLESENKWVALPMSKDSSYVFGFIYLDNLAGLTFQLEGSFKFSEVGEVVLKKQALTSTIKRRLSPSSIKVAVLSPNFYEHLEIKSEPDWLKFYKSDDNDINRLFRLGSTYNAWSNCEKALTYLSKVKDLNADYPNLNFEIAFAYNHLKQFDKAITFIESSLKKNPNDCLLHKELIYGQMNLKEIDKAIENAQKALDICKDKKIRSDLLRDITYHYYNTKNKPHFNIWYEKAKIEMANNTQALQVLAKWHTALNQ